MYFSGQAKPAAWLSLLLRALRLASPEARRAAAAAAQVQPLPGERRRELGEVFVQAGLSYRRRSVSNFLRKAFTVEVNGALRSTEDGDQGT